MIDYINIFESGSYKESKHLDDQELFKLKHGCTSNQFIKKLVDSKEYTNIEIHYKLLDAWKECFY